jgi:hypothetical protein
VVAAASRVGTPTSFSRTLARALTPELNGAPERCVTLSMRVA